MTLAAVARLLGPADGSTITVIDAGPRWSELPERSSGPAVWGRAPARSGTSLTGALRHASRREAALRRVRGRATRWRPPDLGGSGLRNASRNALLGGAIVEIDPPRERVVDAAAAAAGAARIVSFRPASGGSLLARVDVEENAALLRVSGIASPRPGIDHPLVPRSLGGGSVGDAFWSAETLLPGSRPRRVTDEMWSACVDLCASFPAAPAAEAPRADLEAISATLGIDLDVTGPLARLEGLGGAARHGDLWRPNLLTQDGRLTGVVDWDAWHPAAAPGVDLLNLFATERHGPGIGGAWRREPWRSHDFAAATARYWKARGLAPAPADLDSIAVAWWAGQVAATLRRLPHLAEDRAWLNANVLPVARTL